MLGNLFSSSLGASNLGSICCFVIEGNYNCDVTRRLIFCAPGDMQRWWQLPLFSIDSQPIFATLDAKFLFELQEDLIAPYRTLFFCTIPPAVTPGTSCWIIFYLWWGLEANAAIFFRVASVRPVAYGRGGRSKVPTCHHATA